MKLNILIILISLVSLKSNSQVVKATSTPLIVFNSNTSSEFTSDELNELKRDAILSPNLFNALKYNFEFHEPGFQMFRVDGTNNFIIIKLHFIIISYEK